MNITASNRTQETIHGFKIRHIKPGFSLIEIIIGAVIIGMIMAGAFYFVGIALERGRRSKTETILRNINAAVMLYNGDTSQYPQTLNDLTKKPEAVQGWKGSYLPSKQVPLDGWGQKPRYQSTPGQKHPYELLSYGSSAGKATPKDKWISIWDL